MTIVKISLIELGLLSTVVFDVHIHGPISSLLYGLIKIYVPELTWN